MSSTSEPSEQVGAPPISWYRRFIRTPIHRSDDVVPDWIDIAIVVICFGAFTLPLLIGVIGGIGSVAVIALLGAAAVAPLIGRRRAPIMVLLTVSAVVCLSAILGVRFTPWVSNAGPAMAIAVFTAAERRAGRDSALATVAALVGVWFSVWIGADLHPAQDQDFVQLPIAVPAWLLGNLVRTRREYRRNLAAQVRHRAEEEERRIRAEERLRVSRDVHDVLSHTLSMIAVRSGVARMLLDEQPGEARRALGTIETASRSALSDLRHVLAQLREPESSRETDDPGLADIADLVDGMRHDGLVVEYRVVGEMVDHPALLQTTVYRIVQESLTNVVKHAHTDRARVEIRHAGHELTVCVVDDGPDAGQADRFGGIGGSGSGLGLVGMRERVSLFGGRFDAGPQPDGGFAVVASFLVGQDGHDR